jgi:hypothetical protein
MHAGPDFIGRHVEVVDGFEQVAQEALDDLLGASIAVLASEVGSGRKQVLHFLRIEHFHAHVCSWISIFWWG